ncbi:hypothetical protein D043_2983B, partial [Vibrio parahaemolyticus EKP-021]
LYLVRASQAYRRLADISRSAKR